MSARKKINFSASTKVSYEHDIVSVCIYCWDVEYQDIAILFRFKEDLIFLPSLQSSEDANTYNGIKYIPKSRLPSKNIYESNLNEFDGFSWKRLNEELVKDILGEEVMRGTPRVLYLLRTYSPIMGKYFSHIIFGIKISVPDINKNHLVKDYMVLGRKEILEKGFKLERKMLFYILEELYKNSLANESSSPNPMHMSNVCVNISNENIINKKEMVFPGAILEEVNPQIIFDRTKTHQIISPVALFDSPGYSYIDKLRLYEAFVELSFPFSTVNFKGMIQFLTDLGFGGKEEKIFRALDENYCGEIDIYQFMLGLTSMDHMTEHGNGPAEFRCRQIFRYYDEDRDGFLCEKDLEGMIKDISFLQNQNLTGEQIQINIQKAFKAFDVLPSEKISISKFLVSVGNLRFRGTSLLYRATNYIPLLIKKLRDRFIDINSGSSAESKKNVKELSSYTSTLVPAIAAKAINFGVNLNPASDLIEPLPIDDDYWQSSFGYILAQHTVSVRRSGFISNVSNLLDMERAGEVCNTGLETLYESEEKLSQSSAIIPLTKHKHRVEKQVSAQAFNIKSLPNEILSALRYFEGRSKDKIAMSWGQIDKIKLAKYISTTCESLRDILENENRLLHISSPCYILGDLHGNFHDLICFEKALWRLGPHLTPANFLFLGDYVDRGAFGIEVVAYLFAQKLKAPNRFHLLRGNHEIREIQQFFSFYNECIEKFGPQIGPVIWEDINQVFDRMPLAAIVDKKIFCIHGGVPNLSSSLTTINEIPCPLPSPEIQSPLAWQLMWNDPVASDDLTVEIAKQLDSNQGFANNIKRQTAFVFNETAFEKFLEKHKLSHVIRAHEVKQNGFEIQQSGRLFTVFSSSQYCGTNNEAACILVHDLRIRIIRIDTNYKIEQ